MATPPAEFQIDIVAQLEYLIVTLSDFTDMLAAGGHRTVDIDIVAQLEYLIVTLSDFTRDMLAAGGDRTVDIVTQEADRVEELLRSAPSLVPKLEDTLWREALVYLAKTNRWSSVQTLLALGTGKVCWNLLGKEAAYAFQAHPAAITVFDLLSARCLDLECSCIKDYVGFVTRWGLVDRFRILVYSEKRTVRLFVMKSLVNLVLNSTSYRQAFVVLPQLQSNLNDCLTVACEAGLFTTRIMGQSSVLNGIVHRAMVYAVSFNQPDLVRFLYHAGATSNHDLLQLSRNPDLEAKAKADRPNVPQLPTVNQDYPTFTDVDAAKNIQGFLTRVASTPRSLETLCLLQISGHLHWGHGRERKIEQLKIAPTFKKALKFKDHKEFLKYPSQT